MGKKKVKPQGGIARCAAQTRKGKRCGYTTGS